MSEFIDGIEPYKFVPELEEARKQAMAIGGYILKVLPNLHTNLDIFTENLRIGAGYSESDFLRLPPAIQDVHGRSIFCFDVPTFEDLCERLGSSSIAEDEIAELYIGVGLAARLLKDEINVENPEQVDLVASRLSDTTGFANAIFGTEGLQNDQKVDLLDSVYQMDLDDIARINVLRFGMGIMSELAQLDQGFQQEILNPAHAVDKRVQKEFLKGLKISFRNRKMIAKLHFAFGNGSMDDVRRSAADTFSHFELAGSFPMTPEEIQSILYACLSE